MGTATGSSPAPSSRSCGAERISLGTSPSDGVSAIEVGGRRVELILGCHETGEHLVYIEEARRLIEAEHVDVVMGGSSVVTRDAATSIPA